MARFIVLTACLLMIAGCERAALTAHRNDLRLFAEDLRVSIEKAAGTEGSIGTRVSYGCYSDRPFDKLPPAELAEAMNAGAAFQRVMDRDSALTPAERHAILLKYVRRNVPMALYLAGALTLENAQSQDDEALGAEAIRRSAMQGCPPAQSILAFLYWRGIGLERDNGKAYGWAESASYAGLDAATELRAEIAPHATPTELADAKKISEPWRR
ncbi:SEL1-like repeat protein [Shumkonia mesophila]|uniref:hypothetical protein n=1 Tax=Shumkonia mesophila TaxID=2838854 RepID=UPI002934D73E|nr:hypothetical protein [Shumkonia mesophila]